MDIPTISMPLPTNPDIWLEMEREFASDSALFSTSTHDKIDNILSNDQMRQHSGCILLAEEISINFSMSPECQSETLMNDVIESGIIRRLISFTLHDEQEKVQNAAFFVIASIASHADVHVLQSLVDNGCIESIIKCLSSDLQNEKMTHSALSILSHLSRPFRDDILSKGALPIIIALLFEEIPLESLCESVITPLEYGYEPDPFIKHARFISAILSNLCFGEHANHVYYLVNIFKAFQYLIQSEDFEILRNTLRGLQQLVKLRDSQYLDPDRRPSIDVIMDHHHSLFDGFMRENIKSLKVQPSTDSVDIISNFYPVFVCSINDDIVIPRLCKLLCHKSNEIQLLAIGILMKVITGNTKQYVVNELIKKYDLIEYIRNVLKLKYQDSSNVIMSGITDLFLNVYMKCIKNKSIKQQLTDLLVKASQTNPQIMFIISDLISNRNYQTIMKLMIKSEIISKLLLKGITNSKINQKKNKLVLPQSTTNLVFIENEELTTMITVKTNEM